MTQKTWFVTGASRGIGAEIAKAVLAAGDQLVATSRKKADLEQFESNPNVLTLSLDVTDEAQVQAAVATALERFGQIDVLVNNAGFGILGGVEETSAQEVERVYRTNVFGLLNVIRAVLPSMRQRRSGHIINLSSIGGYRSTPGWGVYSSTKFAVEGITEALHDELAPLGIHATVVEPGYFRTGFLDGSSLQRTATEIPDYADTVGRVRQIASELSYQQPGDPVKLAQAMLQLANADTPPLRLPLGTDTLRAIAQKNAYVEQETAQWRALAESTDYR
ncbi:SDR family NAD(P)-dependent oxidoreductase [Nodosilinea sp. LEGE 06152]|uniref:oxidoreductase n=1 Tax=Nodosilinea sp. LEGE 06152 TaxID=2777966 RepID=UPI00187FBE4F|nr:oxidoreductase [Nodosilinea sp. LEGE 06152]MBE9157040.1 SDR family NAD(P)-dependent oxidoreductase [Nodosilinea sp. LEGE 06152]